MKFFTEFNILFPLHFVCVRKSKNGRKGEELTKEIRGNGERVIAVQYEKYNKPFDDKT